MLNRRHLLYGAGLAGLALTVGACAAGGEDLRGSTTVLTLPLDATPHVADAATASARIAWQVMIKAEGVRVSNAAMSPSSVAATLAMLAEGASGTSLQSLDDAFGLTGDDRSAAMGALRQALGTYEDLPRKVDADDPPETPVVHLANRAVIIGDADVSQDFLDRLAQYYDTTLTRVDFPQAKANLDAWAKKHTAGLIEKSSIEPDPSLRLVTQDALLFAAQWRQMFLHDDAPLQFTTGEGTTRDMRALGDTFTVPHAVGTGWEAVRLPYDDALAMDVILPEKNLHPSEMDFDTINASITMLQEADERVVELTMPPSDITSSWELLEPLGNQGIDLGDLGGIFPGASVGEVTQQVRLTVTAKGTVGAALTESSIPGAGRPADGPVELIIDHPFVMRVLDTRTGWPLFVAIVNDPTDVRA